MCLCFKRKYEKKKKKKGDLNKYMYTAPIEGNKKKKKEETGPPFYVVIRATWRSTRLQGKECTFISQLF